MPITRARKEELVAQYVEMLEQSNGIALVSADRMPVPRVEQLRGAIREAGGQYMVTKNTLLTKALEQTEWVVPVELLKGKTAVIFGYDNFPGVAKALLDWLDDNDVPEAQVNVKGGVMGGAQIIDAKGVEDISDMPTLPEIQAQILGLLIAPQQQLVNVLQAANSGVVNVLQAADTSVLNVLQAWIIKQEQEQGDGEAA